MMGALVYMAGTSLGGREGMELGGHGRRVYWLGRKERNGVEAVMVGHVYWLRDGASGEGRRALELALRGRAGLYPISTRLGLEKCMIAAGCVYQGSAVIAGRGLKNSINCMIVGRGLVTHPFHQRSVSGYSHRMSHSHPHPDSNLTKHFPPHQHPVSLSQRVAHFICPHPSTASMTLPQPKQGSPPLGHQNRSSSPFTTQPGPVHRNDATSPPTPRRQPARRRPSSFSIACRPHFSKPRSHTG